MMTRPDENAEKIAAAHDLGVYLFKVASVLRQRRFWTDYLSGTVHKPRFAWDTLALQDRLERDLVKQLPYSTDKSDTSVRWASLADQVEAYATDLAPNAKLKDRRFSIKRGASADDSITELLTGPGWTQSNVTKAPFEVTNALSSLFLYAQARLTLSTPTGNECFEALLASLSESYLLGGYPHDILAHDARGIRIMPPAQLEAILYRESYCSTYLLKDGDDFVAPADFKRWPLQSRKRRVA